MNKEYKIIKSTLVEDLERDINALIAKTNDEGGTIEILGSLGVEVYPGFSPTYYQAVLIVKKAYSATKTNQFIPTVVDESNKITYIPTAWVDTPTAYHNVTSEINPPATVMFTTLEQTIESSNVDKKKKISKLLKSEKKL